MAQQLSESIDVFRVRVPYVYREFPRWIYRWGDEPMVVQNAAEQAAKVAEGWSIEVRLGPYPAPAPLVPEPVAPQPLRAMRGPGRPRKR